MIASPGEALSVVCPRVINISSSESLQVGGIRIVVVRDLAKVEARVRFPYPAPVLSYVSGCSTYVSGCSEKVSLRADTFVKQQLGSRVGIEQGKFLADEMKSLWAVCSKPVHPSSLFL
jgi:hypothetical protein